MSIISINPRRVLQAGHVEAEHGAGRDHGLGDGLGNPMEIRWKYHGNTMEIPCKSHVIPWETVKLTRIEKNWKNNGENNGNTWKEMQEK